MPVNCNVEAICNVEKETKRLPTLNIITDHYGITPSYTVYGEEARSHAYFHKFKLDLNINATSLAINHITILEKYKNSNKPLLIFESDAICLHDFDTIDTNINAVIQSMVENNIDFVFLGVGCFDTVDTSLFKQIDRNLFKKLQSRCTESYIISPTGIRRYLEYFYTKQNNHTAIDADYNLFFEEHTDIICCWLIPELFKQGSRCMYESLVPI
jgi:hypothetical protein